MIHRRATYAVVLVALLLKGCGSALDHSGRPQQSPEITVRAATVVSVPQEVTIPALGKVAFRRELSLGFTVSGRIAEVSVNDGQYVTKGQLLASLDSVNVDGSLSQARAEMNRADGELRRSHELFRQGWVTRSDVEAAEAAEAAARAVLQSARFNTLHARIYAPMAGIVLERRSEPSEVVQAGQGVLRLGLIGSGMVLHASLTEKDANQIAVGTAAHVTIPTLGNLKLPGTVVELAGIADNSTGLFDCLVRLPAEPRLRAGQIGSLNITRTTDSVQMLIPTTAVFDVRAGEGLIYVLDESRTVHLRRIVLSNLTKDGIFVSSGLSPGEKVIISGLDQLHEGAKVSLAASET